MNLCLMEAIQRPKVGIKTVMYFEFPKAVVNEQMVRKEVG